MNKLRRDFCDLNKISVSKIKSHWITQVASIIGFHFYMNVMKKFHGKVLLTVILLLALLRKLCS